MARPASDIRARLLAAARKRFLVDGVDGASLRAIAKDARTNVGMVVYWFETKDDLFVATVEEVYATLLADLQEILTARTTVRARLQRAFARLGSASDLEIDTVRLVLREALLVPPSPRFERLLAKFQRGHIAMVARALAEGVASGELDGNVPLPLLLVTAFGMGVAPQIARRIVGAGLPALPLPGPEVLSSLAVDSLFRGIGARPARGRPTTWTKKPRTKKRR